MEIGEVNHASFDVGAKHFDVSIVLFLSGTESKFKVTVDPGNISLVFSYDVDELALRASPVALIDLRLEREIADWIEYEDIREVRGNFK